MIEKWNTIKGYELLYEVSNNGSVRSLDKEVCQKNGAKHYIKSRKLKLQNSGVGYYQVSLWKDNLRKNFKIHRLVAESFLCNPKNLPVVNHIDGDKLNNSVDNLEWCTYSHNNMHSFRQLNRNHPMTGKFDALHHRSIRVLQINIEGVVVKEWGCIKQIHRELGYSQHTIKNVCENGKLYKGFLWKQRTGKLV